MTARKDKPWTAEQRATLRRLDLERLLDLPNAHTGPFPKTKACAKHQSMCCGCGKYATQIVWKDDLRDSNTWFFAECSTCLSEFCEDCITDNGDGTATCDSCFEGECLRKLRSKS